MNSFRLIGLPFEPFARLFALSDAELAAPMLAGFSRQRNRDIRVALA